MSGVVVLHFWSPTCNPCQVIKPALEDLKEEFADQIQEWVSINIKDDPKNVARRYQVSVVPTIVFLKNNVEVGRHSGTQMAIYYSLLRKAIAA
jgi:thiol-disulfide isomerase/thioredoxin